MSAGGVGGRELCEVISYAIAAYKKGMPAEQIFTALPTDANGWLAKFITDAIEHHRPDVQNVARELEHARAALHPEQIADLAARCGVKGSAAALAEFAALVRDAEPMAPEDMRPAPIAAPVEEAAPAPAADVIGYVEPGHFEELRENLREGCYMKVYAVPFSEASGRPTVPLYASTGAAPEAPADAVEQARMAAYKDAARIAEAFAAGRPMVRGRPSLIMRGRYEGEQAASSNIARLILTRATAAASKAGAT